MSGSGCVLMPHATDYIKYRCTCNEHKWETKMCFCPLILQNWLSLVNMQLMVLSTNFNIWLLSSEWSKILVICWISHLMSWRKTSCQSLLLTLSFSYLLNPSFRHQTIILQRPSEDISCNQTKQPSRTIHNPSLSKQSRWSKREGVLTGKTSKDLGQLAHWIVPVRSSPRAAGCHPPHTGMQTGTA